MNGGAEQPFRVVLLAPVGRDAAIASAMLRDGGLAEVLISCADPASFAAALDEETAFAVATEEALRGADLRPLAKVVAEQPPWSDLPFIILTARGGGTERNPAAARLAGVLGNVIFIERPFHPTSFVSAGRTALRGRLRQFEARGRLAALRQGEDRLRQVNESLETRVGQRTQELQQAHAVVLVEIGQREAAEAQLRQAQKVEAIGQITGGVAHDFNNLLLGVLANLDLLRRRVAGDAEGMQLLDGAMEAAQRGASLTQRLLAFTRQQALEVQPADMRALVRGMSGLIEKSLVPGIDLQLDLPEDLPGALVDHNQVELALLNLVVNARDAMPAGGTLRVALDTAVPPAGDDLPPGDYLRLRVIDTGQGMDEATLRRAVDPFFSTKEPGRGTGLGLSMVDGLARQLQGGLRLSSTPGRGTTAELWLPAGGVPRAPAVAQPPPPLSAQVAPLRILFVEDEAIIALATRRMLVDLGHQVTGARSGPQALSLVEAGNPVDLVITDFSMPKMTGLELAERIRTLRPGLPILLATGYMTLPEGTSLDLPLLSKPYRQQELREKIAQVMRQA